MTALESTVSVMELLPESDVAQIYDFAKALYLKNQAKENPFSPKSEEEILGELELARKHASEGMCRDMKEALTDIGKKYGWV